MTTRSPGLRRPVTSTTSNRGGRRILPPLLLEQHALPGLARVDAEHCLRGDPHVAGRAAKARRELDGLVAELETLGRLPADIENDAAVFGVADERLNASRGGVDDEVRSLAVIGHPLVHGAQEVRPARGGGQRTSFQYSLFRSQAISQNASRNRITQTPSDSRFALTGSPT